MNEQMTTKTGQALSFIGEVSDQALETAINAMELGGRPTGSLIGCGFVRIQAASQKSGDSTALSWELSDEALELESGLALGTPTQQGQCTNLAACGIWGPAVSNSRSAP